MRFAHAYWSVEWRGDPLGHDECVPGDPDARVTERYVVHERTGRLFQPMLVSRGMLERLVFCHAPVIDPDEEAPAEVEGLCRAVALYRI